METPKLLINGKLVAGDQTMQVINPATEEVLSNCPRASRDQLNAAVAAAKAAFPKWSKTDIGERRKLIGQIADVIDANASSLARTLTQEQGKPLPDAAGEVAGMAAFFRYFATLDLSMKVLEDSGERKVELHRRPLGVVGAIIPWNFPLLLLAFKMPPWSPRCCRRAWSTSSRTSMISATSSPPIPTLRRFLSPAPLRPGKRSS